MGCFPCVLIGFNEGMENVLFHLLFVILRGRGRKESWGWTGHWDFSSSSILGYESCEVGSEVFLEISILNFFGDFLKMNG